MKYDFFQQNNCIYSYYVLFQDSWKGMGKMRNCGMRKVKCGIKNAEWRWLVDATNHVTAGFPQITTPVSQPAVW